MSVGTVLSSLQVMSSDEFHLHKLVFYFETRALCGIGCDTLHFPLYSEMYVFCTLIDK